MTNKCKYRKNVECKSFTKNCDKCSWYQGPGIIKEEKDENNSIYKK